jgi:hypothetical protein
MGVELFVEKEESPIAEVKFLEGDKEEGDRDLKIGRCSTSWEELSSATSSNRSTSINPEASIGRNSGFCVFRLGFRTSPVRRAAGSGLCVLPWPTLACDEFLRKASRLDWPAATFWRFFLGVERAEDNERFMAK